MSNSALADVLARSAAKAKKGEEFAPEIESEVTMPEPEEIEEIEDEPKPKAKAKPKPKAKSGSDKAKKAVDDALKMLGEDSPEPEGDTAPVVAGEPKFGADDLKPVARPNGDLYTPRQLGERTDIQTVQAARAAAIPVLLGGYPGCGKTALIEAAFGAELITVEGHGDMEVTDLVGNYVPQPDGSFEWNDGPLTRAMKEGRPFLLDEITLVPAPVLARLYAAMDGRNTIRITEHEGETIVAEEGFFVLGAHNPGAPGAIFSEALASRFLIQIEVESDFSVAKSLGVDWRVIKVAKNLRKQRKEGGVIWAPEMRELLGFQKVASALGLHTAASNLVQVAPEDVRDELISQLGKYWPGLEPLRLGED